MPVYIYGKSEKKIVLIHGLGGLFNTWKYNINDLSRKYEVYEIELPDYKNNPDGYSVEDYVSYVSNVVTKNKIQKAILIGNSLGGQIACVLAAKYPEQYSKLILISSSGLFLETREFKKSFPIWTINNRLKAKEILNSVFYRKHLITDELIDDVFSVVSDKERKKGLIKTIQKTKDYDISEFLLKIMQPTLIFWGQRDEIIPINVANIFKKLIPNSKLLIEPNCGHALQMEAPSFFVVNSESFIDK